MARLWSLQRMLRLPSRLGELVFAMSTLRRWPRTAAEYVGLRRHDPNRLFEMRNGLRLVVPASDDLVTAWVVCIRREYPIPEDVHTVVDVGANIGAFSCLVARQRPSARVVAVEPVPSTAQVLLKNIELNGLSERVVHVAAGLSGTSGTATIYVSDVSAFSSFFQSPGRADRPLQIATLCLGDLLGKHCPRGCDLLKLDCEGAEHDAIQKSPPDVLRLARHICMEYHPVRPVGPTLDHLLASGFVLVRDNNIRPNLGAMHLVRR